MYRERLEIMENSAFNFSLYRHIELRTFNIPSFSIFSMSIWES